MTNLPRTNSAWFDYYFYAFLELLLVIEMRNFLNFFFKTFKDGNLILKCTRIFLEKLQIFVHFRSIFVH